VCVEHMESPTTRLEAYVSATSVVQGGSIDLHVNDAAASEVRLEVSEYAASAPLFVARARACHYPTPEQAYSTGCNWPPLFTVKTSHDWTSGLYCASMQSDAAPAAKTTVYFVVRPAQPGSQSSVLLSFAAATYQAYNNWGGKNLYPSDAPDRARQVSFDRPGGLDYGYERVFLKWMLKNGYGVECCTNIDLHEHPGLLNDYHLLLSAGHDEYWSKEMRDSVEQFIGNGGNVAFFGGNVCWWQVRFENGNRSMVCYKSAVEDPFSGVDNSRITVNWHHPPLNRPENYLTGVSFRNGAGHWFDCNSRRESKAFRVCEPKHWLFENTGLERNDHFGLGEKIVGYETDAAEYRVDAHSNVRATGADGTPPTFTIAAVADLADWGPCGKAGNATLGVYRRTGTVFTAATTDWFRGLGNENSAVQQITRNVLDRLSQRNQRATWDVIGQAVGVVAIAAMEGKIFAATRNGKFCWREPILQTMNWEPIGLTRKVRCMVAGANLSSNLGHSLYGISMDDQLLRRDPQVEGADWEAIGEAVGVVALAASNGQLFAVTNDGLLLRRRIDRGQWERAGFCDPITGMTALDGAFFAATHEGRLWWRPASGPGRDEGDKVTWKSIGFVPKGLVSLTAWAGMLFATTQDGLLWCRDAVPGD
jgi:hypothetical protein